MGDPKRLAGSKMLLARQDLAWMCARNLLESAEERVFFKDLNSRFILVSAGWALDYGQGCSVDEAIGKSDFDFFSQEHATSAFEDEQRIIQTGEPIVGKTERATYYDRPDTWASTTKMPLLDDEGRLVGTWGISRDVTAQVLAEQALAHQALHDPVTGLANRLALKDRLSQALLALDRSHGRLALFFIDLDNFKTINDSLGHDAGDRLLAEVGRRLSRVSRSGDTVARFGGDEFVLLYPALGPDEDIRAIAARAVRVIGEKFLSEGSDLTVTASIGVVVTDDPSVDPYTLLQQADIAMYEAKSARRDGFRFYDSSVHARALAERDLDAALRKAVDKRQLFLLYQPLFSLEDGSLHGVEALVRWRHPERGVMLPGEFVPLAESRGLVGTIDTFVLNEACRQLAHWVREVPGPDSFAMAVNLSTRQFSDPTLVDRVLSSIEKHGVVPSQLCLKITDTVLDVEPGDVASNLAALSNLGVHLALDDFGASYSTLARLQRLNIDILKVDLSLIEQIGRGDRAREIIGAITAMAHALGMSVVGEGIKTHGQFGDLATLEGDECQGFWLARPLTPEQVAELRRTARTPCPSE